MTNDTASRLIDARRSHSAADAGGAHPLDADEAYAVQDAVARSLGWFATEPPCYWKSGGPSRDTPMTHAALPPGGVWKSPALGSHWPFRIRGIEAEIALRIGTDVAQEQARELDPVTALQLIDAMCVSIEIVDSRWLDGLEAPPLAKLADLQSHGALVLGDWVPFHPQNWGQQRCRVQIGSGQQLEFCGSHPLRDPTYVLPAWLRHVTRHGGRVAAGTVVTTGTWIGILHARAGDLVHVEFPDIGVASVQM